MIEAMMQSDQANTRQDDEYRRQRVTRQLAAFANIGRALDSISGRKQIILLSEGFDASLVQGHEDTKAVQADAEKSINGEGYSVDSDARFGSTTATSAVTKMGELLRRSDVVLHAIDIKGLRGGADASSMSGGKRSSNEGLYLVTRPTGGEVFKNANDLSSSFRALLKQQEVVYVLGFQGSAKGTPGKFHNIKVKV
jgi:VWFA-related protein